MKIKSSLVSAILLFLCVATQAQNFSEKIKFQMSANFSALGLGDIYQPSDLKVDRSNLKNENENQGLDGLKFSANYSLNSLLSLGAGIGVGKVTYDHQILSKSPDAGSQDLMGIMSDDKFTLPVFIQSRYAFLEKDNTPYALAQLGFYPEIRDKWSNGKFVEIGMGYQVKLFKRRKVGFRLSYNQSWYKNNLPYSAFPLIDKKIYKTDSTYKNLIFTTEFYL